MSMDWDKLRIFHAVAEAGSFTHAGETLNLSQSAISRQISTLEESLGLSLFHRHARGLLLTEQGEILRSAARDIFAQLSMIEGQLLDSREQSDGPLRITTTEFLGSTWLAPRLAELRRRHPGTQLTLLFDDRIYNLGMREADAAIRLYKPEQPDLIQKQIGTLNFHIYGSPAYLKEHGRPKTAKDLQDHVLIGYPAGVALPFADPNWLLRVAGIAPDDPRLLLMNSMYAIHSAVEGGAGLAMLPDYLEQDSKKIERVLPDLTPQGVEMYFVYPEERRQSKRLALFRDFLLDMTAQTKF